MDNVTFHRRESPIADPPAASDSPRRPSPGSEASPGGEGPGGLDSADARPARHPGRWVGAAIVLLIAADLIRSIAVNPHMQWSVVGRYFASSSILAGLAHTIEITAISMVIGILLGLLLAVMRQSPNPVLSSTSGFYIWIFRGTPVLVQLIFWFNLSALYPKLGIGVPFGGPTFAHGNVNSLMTPFVAANVGLALNEGAYMAEIVRGGLLSVGAGQREAASALGMTPAQTMRRIVLPQAMRVIIPPTGNEVINLLKTTSLVSVIAYPELLYSAQLIYSRTYQTIPLLVVASIWYLIVTTVLTLGQSQLERRFADVPRGPRRLRWRGRAGVDV
jgi:polar amino acid transport system permease protein